MSHTNSLYTLNAAGAPIPATAEEIIAAAREHISRRVRRGSPPSSPAATRDYLTLKLGTREFETFCSLFLDARYRVIEFVELFRGTIDGASVHPREVVKEALRRNAAAVIFAHPHPSGVAEPSAADELITRRLRDALQLVDIRVLDHLLGGKRSVTVAQNNARIAAFSPQSRPSGQHRSAC
ncbi:MAG: JAB domain-containing protein [Steroidobacteraceae bacterium]